MVEIQVKLSDLAIRDMVGIEDYTAQKWSDRQADKYMDLLEQRFYWLAEHVGVGKFRGEIAQGLFSFPQGSHIIFYRTSGSILEVARILHQSMDVEHQFDQAERGNEGVKVPTNYFSLNSNFWVHKA